MGGAHERLCLAIELAEKTNQVKDFMREVVG